ncbi:type II toxin-antitoxin system VapC family toxin [Nocardioides sp.]|uniref:type II toxin-antitoxin system VapC family toxin n=1 Tax=Nocardioides sp. TaxID=35761 RepID=UPI0039E45F7D
MTVNWESLSGRTVLLDTCALLDLSVESAKIAPSVREDLVDPSTRLIVSAASAWEVAVKARQGKLPGGERLVASWDKSLLDLQAAPLVMDAVDAIRAGSLGWAHKDPFDRMLVAQATRYNLPLATSDRVIVAAGIVSTIDTRALN